MLDTVINKQWCKLHNRSVSHIKIETFMWINMLTIGFNFSVNGMAAYTGKLLSTTLSLLSLAKQESLRWDS